MISSHVYGRKLIVLIICNIVYCATLPSYMCPE